MTHVCIDCQGECGVCESRRNHPAGKKRNPQVLPRLAPGTRLVTVPDPVNNPSHYTKYPVEVIELTEHLDFLTGNIVKYVVRAPHKGKQLEDLEKARWYLERLIANVKGGAK